MKFKIEFDCDNAAFGEYAVDEISRILAMVKYRIETKNNIVDEFPIYDINGNKVGSCSLK